MLIPIENILIQSRQRNEKPQAHIDTLAKSIQEWSLLHAPTFELNDGDPLNPVYILRTGESRLRAITQLSEAGISFRWGQETVPPGFCPALLHPELTREERMEIELRENIDRLDLPWVDRVRAMEALHFLRSQQAAAQGITHTVRDTADIISGEPGSGRKASSVAQALTLAPHLKDPEVANAKSAKEAENIVRRKTAEVFRAALLATAEENVAQVGSPHAGINMPAAAAFKTIADKTFDVILTDPPYGIGADKMSTMSGSNSGLDHAYDDSYDKAYAAWEVIFNEGFRVAKDQAHLYMFLDFRHWEVIEGLATNAGWRVWPKPIIWYKTGGGMVGDYLHGPRNSYEIILYAIKGDRKVTGTYADVIPIANIVGQKLHAAQKPIEVYVNLLRRSTAPGDTVLDPCMGSGTIFPAANQLKLVATGFEEVPATFNLALSRINE